MWELIVLIPDHCLFIYFFQINEDMVYILLMLEIIFTFKIGSVVLLPALNPACSSAISHPQKWSTDLPGYHIGIPIGTALKK